MSRLRCSLFRRDGCPSYVNVVTAVRSLIHKVRTDGLKRNDLPRAEDIQLLVLTICSVGEHLVYEALSGRVVVEQVMRE